MTGCDSITVFPSALGWIAIAGRKASVACLSFGYPKADAARRAVQSCFDSKLTESDWNPTLRQRLVDFAEGRPDDFLDVPVMLPTMAPFASSVIERCRRIPYGQTLSYAKLAGEAGSPRAARAVGNVMRANRCPLIIPCHRVIHADGSIGHFNAADGARMKQRLLAMEHASSGLPPVPPRRVRVSQRRQLVRV